VDTAGGYPESMTIRLILYSLLVFLFYFSIYKFQYLRNALLLLLIPFVIYVIFILWEGKARIRKGQSYEQVWKG